MTVQRAEDVLDLLEYCAARGRPATASAIMADLGWPRTSTYRLLKTLEERGYLYEAKARGGYYPSPRWIALADQLSAGFTVPEAASHLMQDLMAMTGETVSIVAPAGPWAIFVAVAESPAPIRYFAKPGHRVPIHVAASGRALLEQFGAAELSSLLARIDYVAYREATPTSPEAVTAAIEKGRNRGYHLNIAEFTPDLLGLAVPMPIGGRRFALLVSGPVYRMESEIAEMAHQVISALAERRAELDQLEG